MKHLKLLSQTAVTGLIAFLLVGLTAFSGGSAPAGAAIASSKSPIVGVFINDNGTTNTATDDAEGIKIGVAAVNAAGGVKGHPIKIVTCNDNGDPNQATACARNAVTNSADLAIVGTGTTYGTQIDPVLTAGGLASIGNSIFSAGDFACTVCFNLSPGIFDSIGSAVATVKLTHAKAIGIPYINLPAGAELGPLVGSLIKPLGATTVGVVPVDETATDLSPTAAAEGAAKPDAIIDGLTTSLFSAFIHAYRQQGFTTPILVSGGVYDTNGITHQLSGVNKDLDVVAEFNYNSPGYQTYLANFKKYAGNYSNHDDEVLRDWLAVKQFAYAASKASSLSRTGVLDAMKSTTAYNSQGLLPALNYSTPNPAFGGKAPTVYDDTVWLWSYDKGKLVAIGNGEGVNVFSGTIVAPKK
jgi:ABC-type branched-subunit amino acid transport system substrate-binding protein